MTHPWYADSDGSRIRASYMLARIRDAEIQQGLDRAHARLLDLIEHPEKIEDLPGTEDADG